MRIYENIYTDSIKDVIGNDIVLDQFDIAYGASFYGSTVDDYITGSLLIERSQVAPGSGRNNRSFTAGNRGRFFSKFYASEQPKLESTFGSAIVNSIPSLAFREIPWSSKVSRTAYRLVQCFDSSERYYDSCLPDLKKCFSANSTELWTADTFNKTAFSPYGNIPSGSIGYMFFNTYTTDRSALGYDTDPVVNNDWTWSYPFETKYDPTNRVIKTTSALGLSGVSLVGSFGMFLSDIEDFLEVYNVTKSEKPLKLSGFFPILPGYLPPGSIPSSARNSMRSRFVPPAEEFDLLGQVNRIPASYYAANLDNKYGISLLLPADVDLSKKESHDWLASYPGIAIPGPEYITGTMSIDDTVRFLFGFGDLNNMTYGYRTFSTSSANTEYSQDFERVNPADSRAFFAYDVPSSTSEYLEINWSNSPTARPWQYVIRDGAGGGYNYISASAIGDPLAGMYWLDVAGTKEWVLLSDTTVASGGNLPSSGPTAYSLCCVDITSSVPWSIKYDRGIVADSTSFFISYFSGIPGYPSHELPLGPLQVVVPLDIITGSGSAIKYDVLSEYNSENDGVFDSNFGKTVAGTDLFPFPPGHWRLNFSFAHGGGTPGILGTPDISAIKNLQIRTFGTGCFPPDNNGQKIGGNNYPQFRTKRNDPRYNAWLGAFPGITDFQVTGSGEIYKSYVFGVSPVIRGWKYGLFSGFPTHSKAVFRRGRFGQFRDMLEQRQYTKFINVEDSPTDNDATTTEDFDKQTGSKLTSTKQVNDLGPAAVEVNFVRRRYRKDERGIGYIYNESVDPRLTVSQNLSPEVTSSVPYFDGVAKHRQESDLRLIKDATLTTLQVGSNGFTVT